MNRLLFFVERERANDKNIEGGRGKRAERKDRRFLPDAAVSRWRKASENVLMLQLFHGQLNLWGGGAYSYRVQKTFILLSTLSKMHKDVAIFRYCSCISSE